MMEKPREVQHVHSEDPSSIMYTDEGDGEPGTSLGCVGPDLGGHVCQPTDTLKGMLRSDALQSEDAASMASLLTAL